MRVAECLGSGEAALLSSTAAAASGSNKGASVAALQLLHATCAAYPPLCAAAAAAGLPQVCWILSHVRHITEIYICFQPDLTCSLLERCTIVARQGVKSRTHG